MKWLIFYCHLTAFYSIYTMESNNKLDLINQVKNLPPELQKDILIKTKETDEHQYHSLIDALVTFKLSKKDHNNSIKFFQEPITENPQLILHMNNPNLKIIYKRIDTQENAIPISSTTNHPSWIAGPNKNNLVVINDKAFQLSKDGKEAEESALNLFYKNGAQTHLQFNCNKPVLIYPEKNCFIGKKNDLYIFFAYNESKKNWEEQQLPALKEPVAFGPNNLLVCKKLLNTCDKTGSLQPSHYSLLDSYELYDLNTKTTYDTLDFTTILQQIISQDKTCKIIETYPISIKDKPFDPSINHLKVNYFPEFANFLLFSFNIKFKNNDRIYAKVKIPFYFLLYDVEKKYYLYLESSETQSVRPLPSDQKNIKQNSRQVSADLQIKNSKKQQENHFFVEKFKPENITNQLVALELIGKTYEWLQEENPLLDEGQKILKIFKDENTIKDKYKLIWQTTTPEHGNIFKKVYEKVKELKEERSS